MDTNNQQLLQQMVIEKIKCMKASNVLLLLSFIENIKTNAQTGADLPQEGTDSGF